VKALAMPKQELFGPSLTLMMCTDSRHKMVGH